MKMKGHFRVPRGCHSPPAHMPLGYPYFPEIRGTDGRTDGQTNRQTDGQTGGHPKTISEVHF